MSYSQPTYLSSRCASRFMVHLVIYVCRGQRGWRHVQSLDTREHGATVSSFRFSYGQLIGPKKMSLLLIPVLVELTRLIRSVFGTVAPTPAIFTNQRGDS